jgi:putative transposase
MAEAEGLQFRVSVIRGLKPRSVEDCFIASVDGLKGLPMAVKAVYPHARIPLCIVHQLLNGLK